MKLHFQSGGLYPAKGQHRLKLRNRHIAHTDIAHESLIHQFLALPPGVHKLLQGKRPGIRVTGIPVAPRRMVIGKRPVDKIQVQAGKPQIRQTLPAGLQHLSFPMHVVPYLGGDKQLFPLHHLFREKPLQNPADTFFILINRRAVNQTITVFHRPVNRFRNRFRVLIRAEGSKSHTGDFFPAVKRSFGNHILVNFIFHTSLISALLLSA